MKYEKKTIAGGYGKYYGMYGNSLPVKVFYGYYSMADSGYRRTVGNPFRESMYPDANRSYWHRSWFWSYFDDQLPRHEHDYSTSTIIEVWNA